MAVQNGYIPWQKMSVLQRYTLCQSHARLQHNKYTENIRRWRSFYSDEQILICFYDDIQQDPEALLHRVHEHLGVEPLSTNPTARHKKIHVTEPLEDEEEYKRLLAALLLDELQALHKQFGGYTTTWYNDALALLGNNPHATLPEASVYQPEKVEPKKPLEPEVVRDALHSV